MPMISYSQWDMQINKNKTFKVHHPCKTKERKIKVKKKAKQSPLSHRKHIILSATLDLFLKRSVSLWQFWSLKSFVLSWSDRLGFIIDVQIFCNLREGFLKNVHRGLLLLRDWSKMEATQKSSVRFFCHLKFENCIIKNLPEKQYILS